MRASDHGHYETVCTLLEFGAELNSKNKVRNQMMMMAIISKMFEYDFDEMMIKIMMC